MSDATTKDTRQELQQDLERAKQEGAKLANDARELGREQLEDAKSQVADQAERLADAVERTAEEIGGDGDGMVSGYGRSLASMMRQLAGGLRERDIDEFARELSSFARRHPGAFLAGSVALGFGISRFMKASSQRTHDPRDSYSPDDDAHDPFQLDRDDYGSRTEATVMRDEATGGAVGDDLQLQGDEPLAGLRPGSPRDGTTESRTGEAP